MRKIQVSLGDRGSMLVYVALMMGAIAVFSVNISGNISLIKKQVFILHGKSDRQFDISQMIQMMKVEKGLLESAGLPGNENLKTCLLGGPKGNCTENCCQGGTEFDLTYVDPTDTQTNLQLKPKLIGTSTAPIYYSYDGRPCVLSNTSACSYKLSASFKAVCPGGDPTCDHAEHLRVKLDLKGVTQTQAKTPPIQDETYNFIYFVNLNYRPFIESLPNLTLYLDDDPIEKEISVIGNSGHPSELQNFKFTKCESSKPDVVEILTPVDQPFSSGVAKITIKPLKKQDATITLQISDGATENPLSKDLSFTVTVLKGRSKPK